MIPTRDRGRLLVDAVASALSAPSPPLEVIVADDGSTDGSVEEAQRSYPQIRVVAGPFGNAARARNAGAAQARGEVLGFLDSDDLMLPGKTAILVERLRSDPDLVLVHGSTRVIGANGELDAARTATQQAAFERGKSVGLDYPGLAEFCAMYTSATAIRRETFLAIGGYDETLDAYEDWDLYLRLSLVGRLVYENWLTASYRIWSGNVEWSRTARWTAYVAAKHLRALPPLDASDKTRVCYGLHRRLAESHNVLGEMRAARNELLAVARIAPLRAVLDRGVWRPFLRTLVPAPLLSKLGRIPRSPA